MKATRLRDIAQAIGGRLKPPDAENVFVSGISTDTRSLMPGQLFFALLANRDGADFLDEAYRRGAVAAVVQKDVESNLPTIRVSDTLAALDELAANYRRCLDIPIIDVNGSIGKTTAREGIACVLSPDYKVAKSAKNFNNLIGLPLSLLKIEEYHSVAVLEVGINIVGEIVRLAAISLPDYVVILNIAPVHLEGLGSLENIAREKLKLLEALKHKGKAFLNADEPKLMAQEIVPRERVVTFGFSESADYRITDFSLGRDGRASFAVNGERIELRLLGRGAAVAAVAAFAVGVEFGISKENIIRRLSSMENIGGRLEPMEIGGIRVIADTYNSSPSAVEAALEVFSSIEAERKVAVLADMLELGANEVEYHSSMGAMAADSGADLLFFFGKRSKAAYDTAIKSGFPKGALFWSGDFDALAEALREAIMQGDLLLIKGSRSMRTERFIEFVGGAE